MRPCNRTNGISTSLSTPPEPTYPPHHLRDLSENNFLQAADPSHVQIHSTCRHRALEPHCLCASSGRRLRCSCFLPLQRHHRPQHPRRFSRVRIMRSVPTTKMLTQNTESLTEKTPRRSEPGFSVETGAPTTTQSQPAQTSASNAIPSIPSSSYTFHCQTNSAPSTLTATQMWTLLSSAVTTMRRPGRRITETFSRASRQRMDSASTRTSAWTAENIVDVSLMRNLRNRPRPSSLLS